MTLERTASKKEAFGIQRVPSVAGLERIASVRPFVTAEPKNWKRKVSNALLTSAAVGGFSVMVFNTHKHSSHMATEHITTKVIQISNAVLATLAGTCYLRTRLSNPGYVTASMKFEAHEKNFDGGLRKCRTCLVAKPDRCHHCRLCGYCVLKMDHHCPVVNNCIGHGNYRSYLQLLGAMSALSGMSVFAAFGALHVADDCALPMAIAASLTSTIATIFSGTLFFRHVRLVCSNKTTIEDVEKKGQALKQGKTWVNKYDLGVKENLASVFGDRISLQWFFAVGSPVGDGMTFHRIDRTGA